MDTFELVDRPWSENGERRSRRARSRPPLRRSLGTLGGIALLLAGCSSSAAGREGAIAAIKRNWVTFFSPSTPLGEKVRYLENGTRFAAGLRQFASLSASVSATIQNVSVTSPTTADVTYTILFGGSPALTRQQGEAVRQDGTWKVASATFCPLLAFANVNPPACASA